MSSKFGKYGEMNTGWTGEDVRGFLKDLWEPNGDLECYSKRKFPAVRRILNYGFK
jgi:hypothetical protein